MPFTTFILAALHLCNPIAPTMPRAELTIRVNLAFDRSISSNAIKLAAREEAAAIWKEYGVDLAFDDRHTPPSLSLDVIVERDRHVTAQLVQVLGRTTVFAAAATPAPIRISFDAVDSLLERRQGANPLLHDYVLAMGLGRVLAHELGHVLLGFPTYHDDAGLMRTTFVATDLARADRSAFRLAERSVARLRARMAAWSDESALERCGTVDR
jgi:hypothetical protein